MISKDSKAFGHPTRIDRDLVHLEQQVNDRIGTDPAPPLPPQLLPEAGSWQPLTWLSVQESELEVLCDRPEEGSAWRRALASGEHNLLFPVHPLLESRMAGAQGTALGKFAVSASYRTVLFEPDADSPIASLVPPEHYMVIKLHLDEPIPGIPGDRRLTRDKVRKCVALSATLPPLVAQSRGHAAVNVIRERVGLVLGDRGALIRFIPRHHVIPMFALFSRDAARPAEPLLLIRELTRLGLAPAAAAERYGEWIAQPLIRAACAAFDQGFSFELHAQNTLVRLHDERIIGEVLFRDLESVQYFPEYRRRRGHAYLPSLEGNPELLPQPREPRPWFNRNIDHDIGRILRGSLEALTRAGFFSRDDCRTAVRSCRRAHRRVVEEFELRDLDWPGQWLRVSRSPYGRGLRRGNYYRAQFR